MKSNNGKKVSNILKKKQIVVILLKRNRSFLFETKNSHFKTLIGIIIGQQISTSAAKSIKSNFFKDLRTINPEIVLEILRSKKFWLIKK